jgi:hypothetical protein
MKSARGSPTRRAVAGLIAIGGIGWLASSAQLAGGADDVTEIRSTASAPGATTLYPGPSFVFSFLPPNYPNPRPGRPPPAPVKPPQVMPPNPPGPPATPPIDDDTPPGDVGTPPQPPELPGCPGFPGPKTPLHQPHRWGPFVVFAARAPAPDPARAPARG